MLKPRRKTREIKIENIKIGNNNPIAVQSMTNTSTEDVLSTIEQIQRLEDAGCEIVRIAVPDVAAARSIGKIKAKINIPLVADIHFDANLALIAIEEGIDKLRLNPGNLRDRTKIPEIAEKCKKYGIPIRVGANSGSVNKEKYNGVPLPEAMVESVMEHIELLEENEFFDIVVSLKSSNVFDTLRANQLFAERRDYPLHIGITESGPKFSGALKSAVGITLLLNEGLGDTIRVSLTSDPVDEVYAAYKILKQLNLRDRGVEIVSCPLCGRAEVDLVPLVQKFEDLVKASEKSVTVAIMGCVVNGPGEAAHADFGFAFGGAGAAFFKKGQVIRKVNIDEVWDILKDELDNA